jgi:hypothetical protein
MSPLEPSYDAFEDASLQEIASSRALGLPVERDIHFTPLHISELKARIASGETP